MKTTIYTLIFFFALQINAQESCDIWINKMDSLVNQNNLEGAKKMMKYYISCKNENYADSKQLKTLDQLSYITKFDGDVAIARNIYDEYLIVDKNLTIVKNLNHIYDYVSPFNENLARVKKNDKNGFINHLGNEVIPIIYIDDIGTSYRFIDGLCKVKKDNKEFYINKNNEKISNYYDIIFDFDLYSYDIRESPIKVENNNKYGFIDSLGKEIIPLIYYSVGIGGFNNNIAAVKIDEKWGYINEVGNFVIEPQYKKVNSFNENIGAVLKNKKWYFVNSSGLLLNQSGFDDVLDFTNGHAPVRQKDKWGLIDKKMNWVILPEFDSMEVFYNIFIIKKDNKVGIIDEKINIQFFDQIGHFPFNRNFLKIYLNNKQGVYDLSSKKIIIECSFTDIFLIDELNYNVFFLKNDEGTKFYEYNRKVMSKTYSEIGCINNYYTNTLHLVLHLKREQQDYYGLYNLKNGKIIEPKYDKMDLINYSAEDGVFETYIKTKEEFDICTYINDNYDIIFSKKGLGRSFNSGLALFCDNYSNPCYFINKNGEKVITLENYESNNWYQIKSQNFSEGKYTVYKNKKCGYINTIGNEIIPLIYDDCSDFINGIACVKKESKFGFIDEHGRILIPFIYDDFAYFKEELALVVINHKLFYINKKGECVSECENAPANHPKIKN